MLKTQLLEDWCHHLAWAAPGSGEVYNYLRSTDWYVASCISLNVALSKVWPNSLEYDRAAQILSCSVNKADVVSSLPLCCRPWREGSPTLPDWRPESHALLPC